MTSETAPNGVQKLTVYSKEFRANPYGSYVLKWIVIPVVVGSSPISHPNRFKGLQVVLQTLFLWVFGVGLWGHISLARLIFISIKVETPC